MYKRECDGVSNGLTRMVPKMKDLFIIHDVWTKLNVMPAKIMQVGIFNVIIDNLCI